MTNLLKTTATTNILIVDDTPDNLRLLAKMLESQGYTVRKSLNGRMALQAVHRDPPDLILLDITMPGMNGYEICQQLKSSEATASIPIIFISALDRIDDKVRAFEMGAQDYIIKPFQELEVLIRVKNQLLIQQQRQQLIEQNQRLAQEIQERLKAEAEVKRLSLTDELTGLYNRRGFFLLAEQQLKIAQRTQTSCCILFADLDGLKQINDSLGHDVGDRAIVDAAQLLKHTFRDADIVARLGGDEFVVLIPVYSDNSKNFHARIQTSLDCFNQQSALQSASKSDRPYQLSISVGVQFCAPNHESSLDALLVQADKLMYDQKRLKHQMSHPSV
ncbi:diguanylate cyclase [Oscillatoria sp. FACHB-1407]|uniref:GGDEF domain-containing response regulator n=1 Tax=Oscillatoria sp. FACHB-1407 TaxID=2692847 RepID=UPI001683F992|nr:diguanylate cyclase [Oscillatoria sp. FACHB-1407]MBD2464818.1 diguanylate cyclase [Oscillatoria sp. FACHB-1407]